MVRLARSAVVTGVAVSGELCKLVRGGGWLVRWAGTIGLLSVLGGSGYLLLLWEPRLLPIRAVTVAGELDRLSAHHLRETVNAHLDGGGLLTQDLVAIKTAVEAMPWVRSAGLRRLWPDRLELAIVERVTVARWGEEALVDADGVVFKPENGIESPEFPKLVGMDGQALKLVRCLLDWGAWLRPLDLEIEALTLDARGAWTLRLSAGFGLALGTVQVQERIARFVRVYPVLAAAGTPLRVDMRYGNGLAIRWAEAAGDGQGTGVGEVARSAQSRSRSPGPYRG